MDGLDFHPYPIPQSLPFATGYAGATSASVSNLPRIYQAFYDALQRLAAADDRPAGRRRAAGLAERGRDPDRLDGEARVRRHRDRGERGGRRARRDRDRGLPVVVVPRRCSSSSPATRTSRGSTSTTCSTSPPCPAGRAASSTSTARRRHSAAMVHDWIASTGGACQGASHPWTPPGVAAASTPPPAAGRPAARTSSLPPRADQVFDASSTCSAACSLRSARRTRARSPLALGDVNHDGVSDYRCRPGAGAVKVLNGKSGGAPRDVLDRVQARRLRRARRRERRRARRPRGRIGAGAPAQVKVFDAKTHELLETLTPVRHGLQGRRHRRGRRSERRRQGRRDRGHGAGSQAQVVAFSGATSTLLETLTPFSAVVTRAASRWPRPT